MSFEKFVSSIVILLFWLWVFIPPAMLFGVGGYWASDNLIFSMIIGSTAGIITSEYIRRKYGLIQFLGRLSSHPDIDGIHNKYNEDQ
ncbi:hypothetical protein [Shewanella gaetbuli]|uniref:Uncharacterized protein n=1 Tax=Shewanella gaetbuli TaxID=220752 RepID=A0A9X1ZI39_9GAMM|nr:hypothetical protein [Shewanella gaetbuli]MCL1142739.1 hypothetical protein [Shewanella gaetbuli]